MKFNDYREEKVIEQQKFRSYKHKLFTEKITNVALSATDDKCYIENNNVNTFTFVHYKIK